MCLWVCDAYGHIYRSQRVVLRYESLLSTLFKMRSLAYHCMLSLGYLAHDLPGRDLCLPSPHTGTGITDAHYCSSLTWVLGILTQVLTLKYHFTYWAIYASLLVFETRFYTPRVTLNLLCNWNWPWTLDPAFTFQVNAGWISFLILVMIPTDVGKCGHGLGWRELFDPSLCCRRRIIFFLEFYCVQITALLH